MSSVNSQCENSEPQEVRIIKLENCKFKKVENSFYVHFQGHLLME